MIDMRTTTARQAMLIAGLLGAALALPAHADVKDGVDAWGRGDYDAAVAQWQGPAGKGDADAMFNMGQAYKLGRGVHKDLARAEDFYHRAALKGHVRAADNYGILLFQTNRQADAMPWLVAAADRGEPRAMYILGIAAYNGDYAAKDWVRAYALMTRAAGTGLQQASTSLAAMNEAIPLDQRQQGVALAQDLDRRAAATRAREMSAADLGSTTPATIQPATLQSVDLPPANPRPVTTRLAAAGTVTAGADYAHPVTLPARGAAAPAPPKPAPDKPMADKPAKPVPAAHPAPAPIHAPAHAAPPHAEGGGWRVQLGAFGQKSNADALWAKVHGRPEIAGHARIDSGGAVSRLMAGGYSEAEARTACATLKSAGLVCLAVNR
jgi:uncharacterized protein